jgi:(hydroxyamino)benzene mutase
MESRARRLCRHGILLFLLGLVTGLAVPQLENPRMGLAAHLEGVMNGIFLLALGAAWPRLRLSPRASATAFGAALYGTYANWAVTLTAAALGTAAMTPLAAGTHRGQPWQEVLVTVGFGSVALAMLLAAAILLSGFREASSAGSDGGSPRG